MGFKAMFFYITLMWYNALKKRHSNFHFLSCLGINWTSFKSKTMTNQSPLVCPCSSGLDYSNCCKAYHEGRLPEDALKLMRSRFSAYALNLSDYIIETTHPASKSYQANKFNWRRGISHFSKSSNFERLEVLDFKETEFTAMVTFVAYITQEGEDASFTERSTFEKVKGRWLYRDGILSQGVDLKLVKEGSFKLLPLAYYGDQVLRQKALPVLEINDEIRDLVEAMVETMDTCDGVGLAAPQVHRSLRLFVTRVPTEGQEGSYVLGPVKVFINPILLEESAVKGRMSEGCLSIPMLNGSVERAEQIKIRYTNLEGKELTETLNGFHARVFLHEYDHIEGVLFVDRLVSANQEKVQAFLEAFVNRRQIS